MTPTQSLIQDLASAHGVDAETIVRAAVVEFALGKGHAAQAQALRTVKNLDASHGDEKRHSTPEVVTKIVTRTNPR